MITFIPLSVPYAPAAAQHSAAKVRTKLQHDQPEVEQPKALAYLLQMDDVRVLIDCGSPEDFLFHHSASDSIPSPSAEHAESSTMASLSQYTHGPLDQILSTLAPTIDLVLLSHSSLDHLGLYAYAYAHLGLKCLAYATMPVQSMGRLTVSEAVEAWTTEVDIANEHKTLETHPTGTRRCLASLEQIDQAFEHVKTVRYLQPTHLDGKCAGITLTAYSAGHSLGGAIWKIRSPTSGTVLVALDWNHNRERHLDGTALLSSSGAAAPSASGAGPSGGISDAVRRPDVLITEIQRGMLINVRRKDRDAALLDLVHTTIQSGHSVLFPIDPSARLLELLVLLDQHWAYAYPHARFPLCLISRTGKEVLERCRTYMEWMTREWATKAGEGPGAPGAQEESQKQQSQQQGKRGRQGPKTQAPSSPLDFRFLRIFPTIAAMDDALPRDQARVVLAVPPSMTHGPSRKLFSRFAENPQDVIVLVQRGEPGSLARWLWDTWNTNQNSSFSWSKGKLGETVSPDTQISFELKSKVPLEGEELRVYLQAEQAEKEKQAQQRALLARSRRRLEADEDDDSSDSDSDSDSDEEQDEFGTLPVGKIDGGGIAEPGSLGRKRAHGVAFAIEDGNVSGRGGANGLQDANGREGDMANQVSFDIYLKGNASRATSFFGAKPNQEGPFGVGIRYRLFPVVERKRRVDGYGETVDVARWLSRRRQIEAAAAAADQGGDKDVDDGKRRKTNGFKAPAPAPPSKFITESVTVQLRCRLAFVEMEGLNDGRALKTLIPQMLPRRLIMVNGDEMTRKDMMAALAANKSMSREVYAPSMGVTVQIGEQTTSYTVNLGEGLLSALHMSRFEDYEVGHVKGAIRFGVESTVPTLEATVAAAADADADSEVEVDAKAGSAEKETRVGQQRGHGHGHGQVQRVGPTLFVGDLKLSTLKTALSGAGTRLPSDFAGEGMLVCGAQNGSEAVTIKKESQGRIVLEGNVGRTFKSVRRAVYELHARVVGQE